MRSMVLALCDLVVNPGAPGLCRWAARQTGLLGSWTRNMEHGSCGWVRTNDLVVNSHPLYR